MFIKNISANNFRNYTNLALELNQDKSINIIHSPNGMGKSNLLEIIYYLSYFRSYRNVLDKELIQKNSDYFFIKGIFIEKTHVNEIQVGYKKKKEVFFNNKKINKYQDVFGKILSVLFCNEDIYIIIGSPVIKRKYFDIFISIYDNQYLRYLQKYHEVLSQKNFILKSKNNDTLISIYNTQLANLIYYIQYKREELIKNINAVFNNIYYSIGLFKDYVKIVYNPTINGDNITEQEIIKILEKFKKKELLYGYSLLGVHRDNFSFIINGIPFEKYASFGQTRLAALVLKLVQTEYLKNIFNSYPILLLDDVILELDNQKQKKFIDFICQYKQIFVTVTSKEYIKMFENKEKINEIEIDHGRIKENNKDK